MAKKHEGSNFSHYLKRVKKEDPAVYKGIAQELLKLRLSLKLRNLREKLHKSQLEVAREAGTSQAAVARYERENYTSFEFTTLARLAAALNADLLVDLKPRREKSRTEA